MKKLNLVFLLIYMALSSAAYAFSQNGSGNVAAAGSLTGTTLASGVVNSSLQSLGTISTGIWQGTPIANSYLANAATTVNGQTCTLGSTCTITTSSGSSGITVGSSVITSGTSGYFEFNNAGVLGEVDKIPAAHGGTGADESAATGVGQWASGTYSVSTALASGTTATTQAASDNSTKVATTKQVKDYCAGGPCVHKEGFSALYPTTGQQGAYLFAPCDGAISAWDFAVDAGTATVQTWKIATGTVSPTVSNSISTSGVAISTGTAIHSTTLGDFTTLSIVANDIIAFNLSAVSGVTKLSFALEIKCN